MNGELNLTLLDVNTILPNNVWYHFINIKKYITQQEVGYE
jgi:hypothetical protein